MIILMACQNPVLGHSLSYNRDRQQTSGPWSSRADQIWVQPIRADRLLNHTWERCWDYRDLDLPSTVLRIRATVRSIAAITVHCTIPPLAMTPIGTCHAYHTIQYEYCTRFRVHKCTDSPLKQRCLSKDTIGLEPRQSTVIGHAC